MGVSSRTYRFRTKTTDEHGRRQEQATHKGFQKGRKEEGRRPIHQERLVLHQSPSRLQSQERWTLWSPEPPVTRWPLTDLKIESTTATKPTSTTTVKDTENSNS